MAILYAFLIMVCRFIEYFSVMSILHIFTSPEYPIGIKINNRYIRFVVVLLLVILIHKLSRCQFIINVGVGYTTPFDNL